MLLFITIPYPAHINNSETKSCIPRDVLLGTSEEINNIDFSINDITVTTYKAAITLTIGPLSNETGKMLIHSIKTT